MIEGFGVTCVTKEQWIKSEEGLLLAGGVCGPGWYWFFQGIGKDIRWFGPHVNADAAWTDCRQLFLSQLTLNRTKA
jgi:hypothetical protein